MRAVPFRGSQHDQVGFLEDIAPVENRQKRMVFSSPDFEVRDGLGKSPGTGMTSPGLKQRGKV